MAEPFIAEIRIFGFNFPPRGWAECNGQILPINQNQALFALLGTTYGGDGRTTFALPDMRSRVPMHAGNGAGLSNRVLGQSGGTEEETLSVAQLPAHSHTLHASTNDALDTTPNGQMMGVASTPMYGPATDRVQAGNTSNTGGGRSHSNLQPMAAVNFCIALIGTFPSRS